MRVRTVFNPDVEVDVSEIEAADLAAQHLLVPVEQPAPVAAKAAPKPKDAA
jgi:hypothetical protein